MEEKYDFYAGFEGEPEYIFWVEAYPSHQLRAWGGYFDAIMRALERKKPAWESLYMYYQIEEGWFHTSPWPVPDTAIAIAQLHLIQPSDLSGDAQNVYIALCSLFEKALQTNGNVIVDYD